MSAWNRDLEELAKNCVLFMVIQFMQIPILRVVISVKVNLILVKCIYTRPYLKWLYDYFSLSKPFSTIGQL